MEPPRKLTKAQLEQAVQQGEQLNGTDLSGAQLDGANLRRAQLDGANLSRAQLDGANLSRAQLDGANLSRAQLHSANLIAAQLNGADLRGAQLEGANLSCAQLKGADLREAQLEGVNLRDATLGNEHHIGPRLADAQWGTINLAVVDWSHVSKLGDEWEAVQKMTRSGKKEKHERLNDYRAAVRANRQLAVALQAQGLSEEAARFAYRAQRLQCIVLRRQKKLGQYLFYTFLETLAGYGYRPIRTVLWYLGIISLFALAYHFFGGLSLYPPDAFVYSLTSFHGRGFFPGLNARPSLHDPLIMLAALDTVICLFIEISFIATFTPPVFGK